MYSVGFVDDTDSPTIIYLAGKTSIVAGYAYIFHAGENNTLTATFTSSITGDEHDDGMLGNLGATIKAPVGSFVIQNNMVHKVVSGGDGVNVGQYRGYITLTNIGTYTSAPGLDLVPMSVFSDNTPTGMSDALHLDNSDETKDHTVYDLQGRKVAKAAANSSLFTLHSSLNSGLYIVNGKKVIMK